MLHRKLGDFAVEYEVNAYCRDAHAMQPLYTALHRNILDLFNEYGVQIMTPSYESDPQQLKVVPKDQWYAAPAVSDRPEPPRRQATAPAQARGEQAGPSVDDVESRGADSQDERTPIK